MIGAAARLAVAIGLAGASSPGEGRAAAPFQTDNGKPTDLGHYELYAAGQYGYRRGAAAGTLPSAEIDYGAAPGLQLHALAPWAYSRQSGSHSQFGPGDVEIGAKYRLVGSGPDIAHPSLAVFPLVDCPTGSAARGLGTGRVHAFLPVWLGKVVGPWSLFGGGGYWINPGPGNRNWWYTGAGATRQVTDALAVGGEIYHTTSSQTGVPPSTAFNLGTVYDVTDHHHVLVSAGRGLQNATRANQFTTYLAYEFTF